MKLSTQQVKEAKKFCKENNLDTKLVNAQLGWGFWEEECNNSFEGYLVYLLQKGSKLTGAEFQKMSDESLKNYRNGQVGKSML